MSYDRQRRWEAGNKGKYVRQRANAQKRGIPFLLTFEEWWRIWEDSGHWAERGRRRGQYVMTRSGDRGAYEVGNVIICRAEENVVEAKIGKSLSEQTRMRISEASVGKVMSEQARERMSKAKTGRKRCYRPDGSWSYRDGHATQPRLPERDAGNKQG